MDSKKTQGKGKKSLSLRSDDPFSIRSVRLGGDQPSLQSESRMILRRNGNKTLKGKDSSQNHDRKK